MLVRRDREGTTRWLGLRVGLFFLAAGIWLAGVQIGNDLVTAVALGVVVVALLLGIVARRSSGEAASGPDG